MSKNLKPHICVPINYVKLHQNSSGRRHRSKNLKICGGEISKAEVHK